MKTIKVLMFTIGVLTILSACSDNVAEPQDDDDQVACTMDAKLCPDGSYVGRIPPSCEFEACPDSNE